jgi:hypothetical protein
MLVRSSTDRVPRVVRSSRARGATSPPSAWLEGDVLLRAFDRELALFVEHRLGRDADDVAVALHAERAGGEDHLQRPIPRHVVHADRDIACDVVGGDDVDVTDLREEPQHVVDVGVAQVDVDTAPGARGLPARPVDLHRHRRQETGLVGLRAGDDLRGLARHDARRRPGRRWVVRWQHLRGGRARRNQRGDEEQQRPGETPRKRVCVPGAIRPHGTEPVHPGPH